jgi:aryl-alcohol dehydrogenase-like predicted oxidoreductase
MKARHQDALPLLDNTLQQLRDRMGDDPDVLIRAALHYSLRRVGADGVVLAGFACPDHIETNLTAAASPLADEDLAFVTRVYDQLRADWIKHRPPESPLGHEEGHRRRR